MGGALPIPFSPIDASAARARIDGADEFDAVHALIKALDGAFLACQTGSATTTLGQAGG